MPGLTSLVQGLRDCPCLELSQSLLLRQYHTILIGKIDLCAERNPVLFHLLVISSSLFHVLELHFLGQFLNRSSRFAGVDMYEIAMSVWPRTN